MTDAERPLARWEAFCLWLLVPLSVGLCAITVYRSAYSGNRKTDFGVYSRAAWSVREGHDLYSTEEDNGWHYVYPPAVVTIFLPFADPPSGVDRRGYVPFTFGLIVWYWFNVGLLIYTIHAFANVVLPARRYSRRWWYARIIPFDICIGPLGFTLGRGQANILLLALLAAMFTAAMRGRRFQSGVWLAGAIGLKIFPGLLLAFPLIRRDWRNFVGVALGSIVLHGVVPVCVWGAQGAIRENERYLKFVVLPGLNERESLSESDRQLTEKLGKELHEITAKHSQSFMAVFHYMRYPTPGFTRPDRPDRDIVIVHWILSVILISVTLTVGELTRRRRAMTAVDWLLFLGTLINAMLLIVPMSHMHYYAIMLPHVLAIWLYGLKQNPNIAVPKGYLAGLSVWFVCVTIAMFDGPFFIHLREFGLATWPSLALWMWGICILRRTF